MKYTGLVAVIISGCAGEAIESSASDLPEVAEVVPAGASDSVERYLIARIDVAPGHSVSFYEPQAGTVGMIELRDKRIVDSVLDRGLDAGRTYTTLRPGEPMPPALRAALQRAAAIEVSEPVVSIEPSSGGGRRVSVRAAVDAWNYVNTELGCDVVFVEDHPVRWSVCRIDWGGGFWASDGGAHLIHGRIAVVDGTVTGRVQVGTAIFDHNIDAGTIATYVFGNNSGGLRRIDVFNAEGDWFHASGKFRLCNGSCASNTWN